MEEFVEMCKQSGLKFVTLAQRHISQAKAIGAILMNTIPAQSLFELPHAHILKLSSAMAVGVSNSLQRFRATQQPLENFTVVVENGEEKEVVLVSFVAKREPGNKGLGSTNSMGRGITYRVRRDNGEVVGEFFHK